jgi:competence protein ComGC
VKRLLVIALFSVSALASLPSHPSLTQVENAIQEKGAANVVQELNRQASSTAWESIEDNVATGNVRWLNVAKQLRQYTDASTSLGLENALAEALPKNASGVLAILGTDQSKEFTIQRVCSGETYIEPSTTELRRHLKASITALEKVSDPQLQTNRSACNAALNKDLSNMGAK